MSTSRLILLFHPFDNQSYKIINKLINDNLTNKIDIVPALFPKIYSTGFPWSIPSLYDLTGNLLAMNPIDYREIIDILEDKWTSAILQKDEELFVESIVKNPYASAISLVTGSYRPFLENCGFLSGALRLYLRDISCINMKMKLVRVEEVLFRRSWRNAAITLAYELARDFYVGSRYKLGPGRLDNLDDTIVAAWLIAKASLGRAASPIGTVNEEFVEYIIDYITTRSYRIIDSILDEIARIKSDKKYIELVKKEIAWFTPFYQTEW